MKKNVRSAIWAAILARRGSLDAMCCAGVLEVDGLRIWLVALLIAGCISNRPANPAATQPVTVKDPATTQPSFISIKPPAATGRPFQFQRSGTPARRWRSGINFIWIERTTAWVSSTTKPMISKQLAGAVAQGYGKLARGGGELAGRHRRTLASRFSGRRKALRDDTEGAGERETSWSGGLRRQCNFDRPFAGRL